MNNAPFFIFGSKRGGTTLLRLMLNKNALLSIPPESHFFIPLLQYFSPEQQLSVQQLSLAKEIIMGHPRFITWGITAEKFDAIVQSLPVPCPVALLIDALFKEQIKKTGKPVWGEKTPEYTSIIPQITRLFPQAFFIVLSRDGRDVSMSLKEQGWEGWSIYQRAAYWKKCIKNTFFLKQQNARAIFIKYEDLVINTNETLHKITGLLGVPFEKEMLNFSEDYASNLTELELKSGVHTKLQRQPKAEDVYQWKTKLNKTDTWKFESICADELTLLGYDVAFYNKSNLLHQLGKYGYIFAGRLTAMLYDGYHSIFSGRLKERLRKNSLYQKLRKYVRKW
ncbi:MAG TPA: sulfotransferase [Panacibacter sp.]|nr:sulfotransferase [Panacibacter sp.]